VTLAGKQQQLIAKLAIIEDPQERLAALMSRAKKWPKPEPLDDTLLVPGCQSRVWLQGAMDNGVLRLRMECDAPMVKGLVALMCELYDGAPPAEVLAVEPEWVEKLGFSRMITPTRLNGLAAVRHRIREMAASLI
jgi:cysteine desulfuration protein SufE